MYPERLLWVRLRRRSRLVLSYQVRGIAVTAGVLFITGGTGVEECRLVAPSTRIGRARDNDLLLQHPNVSQHHARLDLEEGGGVIVDLGSSNGTTVNGEELAPREPRGLHDGDEIRVGPFLLRYQAGAAPGGRSDPLLGVSLAIAAILLAIVTILRKRKDRPLT